jgi:hypothetical protein
LVNTTSSVLVGTALPTQLLAVNQLEFPVAPDQVMAAPGLSGAKSPVDKTSRLMNAQRMD